MAIEAVPNIYKCTMAELYAIIRLAIKNYKNNLAKFTTHKPKYTLAFGDAILTSVTAAEDLPTKEQRDQDAETFRGHLLTLGKKCTDNWNIMESYIKEVYKGTDLKPALQAAGSKEYDKLADKNWEYGIQMNKAAKKFMTDNLTVLLDGGNNMPAGFPAAYDLDAAAYDTKYANYSEATETTTATNNKIKANNAIYATTLDLLEDGKTIGQNDDVFVKLFTWAELKLIVSPPGAASLKVEAKDKATNEALVGVKVLLQADGGTPINVTTAVGGTVKESGIDVAVYKGHAEFTGYQPLDFVKEVDKGVDARVTLLMVKI